MSSDETSTVGANLRRLRTARGLTQEALAEKSGVSRGTIATLELGTRTSTETKTVEKLAQALGASVGEFFGDAAAVAP